MSNYDLPESGDLRIAYLALAALDCYDVEQLVRDVTNCERDFVEGILGANLITLDVHREDMKRFNDISRDFWTVKSNDLYSSQKKFAEPSAKTRSSKKKWRS